MTTWHASIGYTITPRLTEDTAFDVLDALGAYGASQSVSRDFTEAHATMTVTAPTAIDAIECATDAIRAATAPFGTIDITELRAITPAAFDAELAEPIFPPVVGFAEIADRAGVTRQRARQFTKITGFPPPVIETAQGPLFNLHAIERWLETRDTTPGRRKKVAASA
ncbi:hypothetical protein [uncultured Gulosibacter sp.]|uniref:hypothetical protein n=1 Tax=uncultured Gulosibacter sp. TaxID=1339167 RepID=UPI00288B3C60|nr:hypothetical protein [uncultured Gulosibacter sp.]